MFHFCFDVVPSKSNVREFRLVPVKDKRGHVISHSCGTEPLKRTQVCSRRLPSYVVMRNEWNFCVILRCGGVERRLLGGQHSYEPLSPNMRPQARHQPGSVLMFFSGKVVLEY